MNKIIKMGIQFRGRERFQRGRGIGGLLRMAKSLFEPVLNTVGKVVKSNSGKNPMVML